MKQNPKTMSHYMHWAQREHPTGVRIAATLPAGFLVAILFPLLIVRVGPAWDQKLGLPVGEPGALNDLLGGLLVALGFSLGFWSVWVQMNRGRGTPLPMLPTQELLTRGPFRYCRNPMTLGTFLAYFGLVIIAETVVGLGFVLCFAALLLFYLKRFEERELTERFGEPYVQYKRDVPFIIPRIPK